MFIPMYRLKNAQKVDFSILLGAILLYVLFILEGLEEINLFYSDQPKDNFFAALMCCIIIGAIYYKLKTHD